MEPLMPNKRLVAAYVAYRRRGDEYEFYLQKRDLNAKTSADKFGLFGGGVDGGESVEDGFYREVSEELQYRPVAARYFSRYEHASVLFHVFIEKVGPDFESAVVVSEGEYGKFFTLAEAFEETRVTNTVRLIIEQMGRYLAKESD